MGALISSAETYPTTAGAIAVAALNLLGLSERLEAMDRIAFDPTYSDSGLP